MAVFKNLGELLSLGNGSIKQDSRGEFVNPGDYFVYTSGGYRSFPHLSYGKIVIIHTGNAMPVGMNESESKEFTGRYIDRTDYIFKIDLDSSQYNSYALTLIAFNEGRLEAKYDLWTISTMQHYYYKKTTNSDDLRKHPITDYLGRTISLGDLVMYTTKKGEYATTGIWEYGLVISNTQVYTNDLVKLRLHDVLLVNHKTEKENEIYKDLVVKYKRSSIKNKKDNTSLRVGDIYRDKAGFYLYLGKLKFGSKPLEQSDYTIDFVLKEDRGYWLNLPIGNISSLDYFIKSLSTDKNKLNSILCRALLDYKMEESKYIINKDLYAVFNTIIKFNSFLESISRASSYVEHLDLSKHIVLSTKEASGVHGILCSFEFSLDLG